MIMPWQQWPQPLLDRWRINLQSGAECDIFGFQTEIPLSILQGISVRHNLREDHGQQTTTWGCKGWRRKSTKMVGGSKWSWSQNKFYESHINIVSFVDIINYTIKNLQNFPPRSWVWVGVGWTNLRRHIQTPGLQRSRGTDIAMRQSCGEQI